ASKSWMFFYFFFQAEDGIRRRNVTGVQTCALPILSRPAAALQRHGPAAPQRALRHADRALPGAPVHPGRRPRLLSPRPAAGRDQIGRATSRQRVTLMILTLSVSRLLNLLLRRVSFV